MMSSSTNSLSDALLRSRNEDGGWGYYPGKASRIEPTAWAALCLGVAFLLFVLLIAYLRVTRGQA